MTMYLIDTNVCIFALNQRQGFEKIAHRLEGMNRGEVCISSISVAELQYGVWASQRQEHNLLRLERFLAEFEVVPFDDVAARTYGRLRARLKATGTPIGPLDTLIAGHALALGAIVVTNNVREFRRIRALIVEDWLA